MANNIITNDKINEINVPIKTANEKDLRKEVTRLAGKANKRLRRLEGGGYESSPAYQKWLSEGGQNFGVRGKDYNQVQAEKARLRRFLDSQTSTIRGINRNLKEIASHTGIRYKNLKDLQRKADKFFELSSKVEQYLRTVEDMASAIGYQKIWEAVNQYVKETNTDLASGEANIEELTAQVSELITMSKKGTTESISNDDWILL